MSQCQRRRHRGKRQRLQPSEHHPPDTPAPLARDNAPPFPLLADESITEIETAEALTLEPVETLTSPAVTALSPLFSEIDPDPARAEAPENMLNEPVDPEESADANLTEPLAPADADEVPLRSDREPPVLSSEDPANTATSPATPVAILP
jgi:hypothetical protein